PASAPQARANDRDLVGRPGTIIGLAAALLGVTVVVALPWLSSWAPGLPTPVLDALALDPGFLQLRAAWILLAWAAMFALMVIVLIAGRWTVVTLRLRGVLDVATVALLLWWVLAGP